MLHINRVTLGSGGSQVSGESVQVCEEFCCLHGTRPRPGGSQVTETVQLADYMRWGYMDGLYRIVKFLYTTRYRLESKMDKQCYNLWTSANITCLRVKTVHINWWSQLPVKNQNCINTFSMPQTSLRRMHYQQHTTSSLQVSTAKSILINKC